MTASHSRTGSTSKKSLTRMPAVPPAAVTLFRASYAVGPSISTPSADGRAAPRLRRRSIAGTRKAASPHDGSSTRSAAERIAQAVMNSAIGAGVKNAPLALRKGVSSATGASVMSI